MTDPVNINDMDPVALDSGIEDYLVKLKADPYVRQSIQDHWRLWKRGRIVTMGSSVADRMEAAFLAGIDLGMDAAVRRMLVTIAACKYEAEQEMERQAQEAKKEEQMEEEGERPCSTQLAGDLNTNEEEEPNESKTA
jgi:hypothetical protein